jgi:hypothetical protein
MNYMPEVMSTMAILVTAVAIWAIFFMIEHKNRVKDQMTFALARANILNVQTLKLEKNTFNRLKSMLESGTWTEEEKNVIQELFKALKNKHPEWK